MEWYSLNKDKFILEEEHIGQFVYGTIRLQGKRIYKTCDIYIGEWMNGKKQGRGILYYSDKN